MACIPQHSRRRAHLARLSAVLVALALWPYEAAYALEAPKPAAGKTASRASAATQVRQLDWDDLLPASERDTFSAAPPAPLHDYLGENAAPAAQPMSYGINQELDGKRVKLPGFIVPLDLGPEGLVSEFFLVPYFGACIHVPPPPPNQIVYVKVDKGIALDSIYEAYWITGRMQAQNKSTRLGASAYALTADKVEIYEY